MLFEFKKKYLSFNMNMYKANDQILHFLNIAVSEKVPKAQSALKIFCQIQLSKRYLTKRKLEELSNFQMTIFSVQVIANFLCKQSM